MLGWSRRTLATLPLLLVALALTTWALAPGLKGAYAFDDVANLSVLGQYGPVDNFNTLLRYVTSGRADPSGRPVSLLTFLVDARDWPALPLAFKRTNLILHLFNGVLLALALSALGSRRNVESPRHSRAAILAAAIWLLHPLLVSTTLYVVQREAMLPATFFLLGLLGWIRARDLVLAGRVRAGWSLAVLAVLGGTLLAALSKLNGLLLPLLVLVCDRFLLDRPDVAADSSEARGSFRRMRTTLLVAPSLLIAGLLIFQTPVAFEEAERVRAWSLWERAITQPRVLFHYLGMIWLPEVYSDGLFNDQVAVSRGLLSPPTTLLAIFGVALLLASALAARRKYSALAGATLFFLAGHAIEAGPVALELYFEHRNYVPMLLMFWPLSLWLTAPTTGLWLRRALILAIPLGLALMTHTAASLWGDPAAQAMVWAEKNPASARAQAFAAQWQLAFGDAAGAESRLRKALLANPRDTLLALNLLGTTCSAGGLQQRDVDRAADVVATQADILELGVKWLQQAINMLPEGKCPGLSRATVDQMLTAFESNPRAALDARRRSGAWHVRGLLNLHAGNLPAAERAFQRSVETDPDPLNLLVQSSLLHANGGRHEAARHLDRIELIPHKPWYRWRSMADLHAWILWRQGYWQSEAANLRQLFAKSS